MSYYDLTKDFVLSAKELFTYHVKRDNTIPSKGGQKDFEPDGSWIQTKALEAFMQERTSVLSEPRVEKLKSLVEGVWDQEEGLVNLKKPGKFWAHMGFTDQRRNWLYPEEALFLMECNTLEVYYQGVPLSIQEAFSKFLGTDVSVEEYQVFAHLRRLGYVVLRHEEQPVITAYERQLNLDKYMSKKNRKDRKGKFLKKGKKFKQSMEPGENLNGNDGKDSQPSITVDNSPGQKSETKKSDHSSTAVNVDSAQPNESPSKGDKCQPAESSGEPSDVHKNSVDSVDSASAPTNPNCSLTDGETAGTTITSTANDGHPDSSSPQNLGRKRHRSYEEESQHDSAKKIHTDDAQTLNRDADLPSSNLNMESKCLENLQGSAVTDDSTLDQTSSSRRFYDNTVWTLCFQNITKLHQSSAASQSLDVTDGNMTNIDSVKKTDIDLAGDSTSEKACLRQTAWESSRGLPLPNIANQNMVSLTLPDHKFLPSSVEIDGDQDELLLFDVEEYRLKNPPPQESRQAQREEERDARIRGLSFSFAEWTQQKPRVSATNWAEYKKKVKEWIQEISTSTPVDHLWQGKVTPLVRPEDAWSNQSILDRLSIIQSADNETLLPDSDCVVDVKITYDVHLPDHRFKKSMPGVPNHRVCITKCSADPPGLVELQQAWSRFKDGVPLHWAVVDSGEIAFYMFDNSHKLEVLP